MKFLRLFILIKFILLLYSCGAVKEGFTNQRKNSSDEFFVEKKSPLVMPPSYNELPNPTKNLNNTEAEEDSIKKLLNSKNIKSDNLNESKNFNKSFEDMLLEKINNN